MCLIYFFGRKHIFLCDFFFLGIDIVPEECNVTMGIIPDRKYPFSDHEGVAAIFSINQNAKCKYFLVVLKTQTEEGELVQLSPSYKAIF